MKATENFGWDYKSQEMYLVAIFEETWRQRANMGDGICETDPEIPFAAFLSLSWYCT